MILLDTNLLTRLTRSHDPQSGVARRDSNATAAGRTADRRTSKPLRVLGRGHPTGGPAPCGTQRLGDDCGAGRTLAALLSTPLYAAARPRGIEHPLAGTG